MRRSLTTKIYKTDVILLQPAFVLSCSFSIFSWIHNNRILHSNFPCIFIPMLVAMGERVSCIRRCDNLCSDVHPSTRHVWCMPWLICVDACVSVIISTMLSTAHSSSCHTVSSGPAESQDDELRASHVCRGGVLFHEDVSLRPESTVIIKKELNVNILPLRCVENPFLKTSSSLLDNNTLACNTSRLLILRPRYFILILRLIIAVAASAHSIVCPCNIFSILTCYLFHIWIRCKSFVPCYDDRHY